MSGNADTCTSMKTISTYIMCHATIIFHHRVFKILCSHIGYPATALGSSCIVGKRKKEKNTGKKTAFYGILKFRYPVVNPPAV
jgi:hypothetical protein